MFGAIPFARSKWSIAHIFVAGILIETLEQRHTETKTDIKALACTFGLRVA